ncbi:MAG: hypothetical protein Q8Q62_03800 [Mesorhizobium sp.]|nr:hypothetical protein [Mesorhizobium sp.]
MPVISKTKDYNGFAAKVERLQLQDLVDEVALTMTGFELYVAEKKHANGTRGIRQSIDSGFERNGGWKKLTIGGIDWTKQNTLGATIGVEVQVSGRSDMLAVDIMHLQEKLIAGTIDVGVIVVPDDPLSYYLTDRTPNFRTAVRHVENRASHLPIRIWAFGQNGVGDALSKMRTNLGRMGGAE